MPQLKQWLVFEVGCIECGVASIPVATYETKEKAETVARELQQIHYWREGGQNYFGVFDLFADPDPAFKETLDAHAA